MQMAAPVMQASRLASNVVSGCVQRLKVVARRQLDAFRSQESAQVPKIRELPLGSQGESAAWAALLCC